MADEIIIETTTSEVIEVGVVGPQGASGQGVPVGGTTGQVLSKASGTNYDTQWVEQTGGGGDFSSPGPIGDVVPNTGAFTTISASGLATLPHIHGSLAGNLYIHVKNTSGGALSRGTPVYVVGNVGATDRVEVAAADFDDVNKMPAVGLLNQNLAHNGTGDAIIVGELASANTAAYALAQELFVGNAGTITGSRPTTGEIQSIGTVARVQSSTGVIVVNMQARRSPLAAVAISGDYDDLSDKPTIPAASTTTPAALGTAAVGTGTTFARADHVHTMPTATNVGAQPAVSLIEVSVTNNLDMEPLTEAQIPCLLVFITDSDVVNPEVNVDLPQSLNYQKAGAEVIVRLFREAGSTTGINLTVSAGGLLFDGIFTESSTLTFRWDGVRWLLNSDALDSNFRILGSADATKKVAFELDTLVSTATTRTLTVPNSSGTIALLETLPAGGTKTYAVFRAYNDSMPPSTAFATLDSRNNIGVADFDDATDESLFFMGIIPEAASLGSGLKIRLHWMATTATSGNVVWDVSLERMNTDLDSDSFATIASGTAAASGTSGILTVTEITLTTIDSVTAGDGFRLKVTRMRTMRATP